MSCHITNCINPHIPRGKYCELHRTSKLCVENGCKKCIQGKSDKCIEHGGGTRCIEPGCNKSARGKSNKCKAHGGGTRCIEHECKKSARSGSDKCVEHGGGTRCVEPGCKKSARDGYDKCVEHGGGTRCVEPGCKKSARSGSDKCKVHGGGKRCVEYGCKNSAIDGYNKCNAHGGGARCPNCIDWIDSRSSSSKYDNYCATCFKRLFPDDSRSIRIYEHTKEIRVRNAIIEASSINPLLKGFVHDRSIYTGDCDCTHRRRVDHRKLFGNTILAIETDEFAHRTYDEKDEEIRYDDLYMIHSGKWIYIRFNPDITRTQQTDIEDRIDVLIDVMEQQIERILSDENTELVEIIKLFY